MPNPSWSLLLTSTVVHDAITSVLSFFYLDIDECLTIPCMQSFLCNNIDGSFECLCPPGTVVMDDECLGKLQNFLTNIA